MLTSKFVELDQENRRLIGDVQQVTAEKVQHYAEFSQWVHELENTLLQQQAAEVQTLPKEREVILPAKFDGKGLSFVDF